MLKSIQSVRVLLVIHQEGLGKGVYDVAKAVILHTIEDVKHCLKHGLHKDARLFSANINVVYYLKHHYGIECEDLCSYVEPKEYLRIQELTLEISKSVLSELDQQMAPQLNQEIGLSIKYFEPLYSFVGALHLALYMLLTQFLTCMLRQNQWSMILIYDGNLGIFNSSIEGFLAKMFPEGNFQVVSYKTFSQTPNSKISNIDFKDIPQLLQHDGSKIPSGLSCRQGAEGKRVLVFEPMTMQQYIQAADVNNLYAFNPGVSLPDSPNQFVIDYRNMPSDSCLQSIRLAEENVQGMVSLFYQAVKEDFCRNLVQYLQVVHAYINIHDEKPIQYLYWEVPPYQGVWRFTARVLYDKSNY